MATDSILDDLVDKLENCNGTREIFEERLRALVAYVETQRRALTKPMITSVDPVWLGNVIRAYNKKCAIEMAEAIDNYDSKFMLSIAKTPRQYVDMIAAWQDDVDQVVTPRNRANLEKKALWGMLGELHKHTADPDLVQVQHWLMCTSIGRSPDYEPPDPDQLVIEV